MKTYWGSGGITPRILILGIRWSEWSVSCPGLFVPGERSCGTQFIGGWVSLGAGLDAMAKIKNPPLPRTEPGVAARSQILTDLSRF